MITRMKLLQELKIEFLLRRFFLKSPENGEPMQLLHYGIKERFKPHYDSYQDFAQSAVSGNRIATVFMFLSNVTQGGETIFLHSELKGNQLKDRTWSECVMSEHGIKPIKGNALLLFNLHLSMTTDSRSFHGSCPVVEGEKWLATKWVRVRAFEVLKNSLSSLSDGEECTDEDDNCPQWAAMGECQKNPVFMLGTLDYYGTCRKSCKAC